MSNTQQNNYYRRKPEQQYRSSVRCHCGWVMTCERPALEDPKYDIIPSKIVREAYGEHVCGAPPKGALPKGFASNGKKDG